MTKVLTLTALFFIAFPCWKLYAALCHPLPLSCLSSPESQQYRSVAVPQCLLVLAPPSWFAATARNSLVAREGMAGSAASAAVAALVAASTAALSRISCRSSLRFRSWRREDEKQRARWRTIKKAPTGDKTRRNHGRLISAAAVTASGQHKRHQNSPIAPASPSFPSAHIQGKRMDTKMMN